LKKAAEDSTLLRKDLQAIAGLLDEGGLAQLLQQKARLQHLLERARRLVVRQEGLRARTDLDGDKEELRHSQRALRFDARELVSGSKGVAWDNGKGGDEGGRPGKGSGSAKGPGGKGSSKAGGGTHGTGKGDQPKEESPVKKLLDDAQKYMKQA